MLRVGFEDIFVKNPQLALAFSLTHTIFIANYTGTSDYSTMTIGGEFGNPAKKSIGGYKH
jgi:hypothetical protein